MGKNLVLRERFMLFLSVLLFGILGGAAAFWSLTSVMPKGGGTVTEKVTEKQVYIENSPTIDVLQKVSPSVVSLISGGDYESWNKKDGGIQADCFSGAVNCTHVGVILTSDGLILSPVNLNDKEIGSWMAIDNSGVAYQLIKIGDVGAAWVYQMVKVNERQLPENKRTVLFNFQPVLLGDLSGVLNGQQVLSVNSALGKSLKTDYGMVESKLEQKGYFKPINADFVPVELGLSAQLTGDLIFDLDGELIDVRSADFAENLTSEQIKAFLERFSANKTDFGAVDLGVKCLDLDKNLGMQLGVKVDYGCVVGEGLGDNGALLPGGVVKKSPADKAGLKSGDVILEMDNNSLLKANLGQLMLGKVAGDKVDLLVLRDGKTTDVTVSL